MAVKKPPETEQRHYPLAQPGEAEAIIIHCSEPQFQKAFRQFVSRELGIKNPIPVILPGGIHDFLSPTRVKAARLLIAHLEFMIKEGGVRRIVIINHEGCGWYAKWNALVRASVGEEVTNHLLQAAAKLAERKWGITIPVAGALSCHLGGCGPAAESD